MTTTLLNKACLMFLQAMVVDLPISATVVCGGVYRGGDIVAMHEIRPDLKFIAIDSFLGLADPCEQDIAPRGAVAGECNAGGVEVFRANVEGIDVEIHQCWISDDTLAPLDFGTVDMLWLDLDHYEPTLAMLKKFLPHCTADAIVLTHDYGFGRCPGVKKACDEFGKWRTYQETMATLERESE